MECDPEIYTFVLTRAVYGYVFGPKRDQEAPLFFKLQTRELIDELRAKYDEDQGKKIEACMQNFSSFDENQEDDEVKVILNDLKKVAYGELQNSLFTTKCWEAAVA